MSIEFFARPPLHGETQYITGDNRNRGDWNRQPQASPGAVSSFSVGDDFTYRDDLSQVARAADINDYPHLEEIYRRGDCMIARVRVAKAVQAGSEQAVPPVYGQGLVASAEAVE